MGKGNKMHFKSGLAPIVARDCRLLILGSLPGDASLAAGRYYAHPTNQFWRLVGAAIQRDLQSLDYDDRLLMLKAEGIGLWDVIASGQRAGSLDAAIRSARGNDLAGLVADLPGLRAMAFNGKTAARIGRSLLGPSGLDLVDLPSSSAAHTLAFAAKAQSWRTIADLLA